MENTKVTKVVGEVLLSRVILVGLQELFQQTLFLQGLTDRLGFLQGDSTEGCASGLGPPSFPLLFPIF
jgi:hypothetical protein